MQELVVKDTGLAIIDNTYSMDNYSFLMVLTAALNNSSIDFFTGA